MKYYTVRLLQLMCLVTIIVIANGSVLAQDSMTVSGTSSSFVEIKSGGNASMSGNSGGS